eukprot:jgi/Ulvmu1/4887/UM020_0173.1
MTVTAESGLLAHVPGTCTHAQAIPACTALAQAFVMSSLYVFLYSRMMLCGLGEPEHCQRTLELSKSIASQASDAQNNTIHMGNYLELFADISVYATARRCVIGLRAACPLAFPAVRARTRARSR